MNIARARRRFLACLRLTFRSALRNRKVALRALALFLGIAGILGISALRAVLFLLGLLTVIAAAAAVHWSPSIVDIAADKLLSNARAPSDDELPPTAHGISYGAGDIQLLGGQGEELSCSITPALSARAFPQRGSLAPISLRMRQACVFHDYCYRHGAATYGYTQADCDYLLLEHAYRICRFINSQETVEKCVSDARKVLLGVRIGGSDNFKRADRMPFGLGGDKSRCHDNPQARRAKISEDLERELVDDCASSYFEFNPFPLRTESYVVYRIADAPKEWNFADFHRKALYKFEVRPSGTLVTVVGWSRRDVRNTRCVGYELPARFAFLNIAPQVVRGASAGGEDEDWFVWWRRFSMNGTGGRLAVLAPRRAGGEDWASLFPGAIAYRPANCDGGPVGSAGLNALLPAWGELQIGTDSPEDAQFSELHAAPGFEPHSGLRLVSLRPHSCPSNATEYLPDGTSKKITTRPICFLDILVDPSASPHKKSEPYIVRDNINRLMDARANPSVPRSRQNDGAEPDRYRNFVSPPFALIGPAGSGDAATAAPMLAWLRRGEVDGRDYDKIALLRRAYRVGNIGNALPPLKLLDFGEAAEPVFVIDRTSTPKLASIQAKAGAVVFSTWPLPSAVAQERKVDERCFQTNKRLRVSLAACAEQDVPRVNASASCTTGLDETWLVRRPVVMPARKSGQSAEILFSRMRLESGNPGKTIDVEIILLTVKSNVRPEQPIECELVAAPRIPLNVSLSTRPRDEQLENKTASGNVMPDRQRALGKATARWEIEAGKILREVRESPVLVADIGDGARYFILPSKENLAGSTIAPLP